jgi:FixJ family two-component response regulator
MSHVISIVDDDESFRGAIARLVRSLGHSVLAFDSAEGFLQSGRVSETECLICDVRMPRMGGLELQGSLLDKGHRLPIIVVTANPTESARRISVAAGAIGFLSKPCNQDTLIALLDEALRGRGMDR